MNGYSEGQFITVHMPKKLGILSEDSEIKLEEDPFEISVLYMCVVALQSHSSAGSG